MMGRRGSLGSLRRAIFAARGPDEKLLEVLWLFVENAGEGDVTALPLIRRGAGILLIIELVSYDNFSNEK
jgi:hypothetical protein